MQLYKFMTANRMISLLEKLTLRFTPPLFQNDPFEYRPYIQAELPDFDDTHMSKEFFLNDDSLVISTAQSYLIQLSQHLGVCSFSQSPNSILMWSHYAHNHTGACVSFNSDHDFFKQEHKDYINALSAVEYSDTRPIVSLRELRETGFLVLPPEWPEWRKFVRQRLDVLVTKSHSWEYEKEVRLLRELPNEVSALSFAYFGSSYINASSCPENILQSQLVTVPPEAIQSVILGARCVTHHMDGEHDSLEEKLRELLKENPKLRHVRVLLSRLDHKAYSVNVFDPHDTEAARKYLHPQERIGRIVFGP